MVVTLVVGDFYIIIVVSDTVGSILSASFSEGFARKAVI
jgi:hypothetical protein